MAESPDPFDRNAFSAEITEAFEAGAFLDSITGDRIHFVRQHYKAVCDTLIDLNNAGTIDLLKPIIDSHPGKWSQRDFWFIQSLYCSLIPKMETHVDPLIDAVERLIDQAGAGLNANRPNGAFRDWLKLRPQETKRLLLRVQKSPDVKFRLLTFVLEAGATQNLVEFHAAAITFLDDKHCEYRLAGVTALGRIDTGANEDCHIRGLLALCDFATNAHSDPEMAQAIGALLDVYARRAGVAQDKVIAAVELASQRLTPDLHYLLAQSLAFHHKKFSTDLQQTIIRALESACPGMPDVVDQIDLAFSQCLNDENREVIADCISSLLEHPNTPLDLADLGSFIHKLTTEKIEALNWLVVRWLRFGSHHARNSLPSLFRRFSQSGYELSLQLGLERFQFSDEELIFISRKALGYFLIEAATAASILIACLRASTSKAAGNTISQLLFDPLMINFSGQARAVVERQAKLKRKKQQYLKDALKAHDDYLESLRSVGEIPELWPSPSERQVQAERQRQQFARAFKEAERFSVLLNLVTKQTLLHGVGSAFYIRSRDGQLNRSESLLSSHGTSVEFPRLETVDPVFFQHLILQFRNETLD